MSYSGGKSRDNVIGVVTSMQAGQPRNRGSIPARGKKEIYIFPKVSGHNVVSIKLPI